MYACSSYLCNNQRANENYINKIIFSYTSFLRCILESEEFVLFSKFLKGSLRYLHIWIQSYLITSTASHDTPLFYKH